MPRNGSGTFVPPANSWNPAQTGTVIEPTDWNAQLADLANGLTQSISKDGQTTYTGNQPMGGNKLTGLGAGAVATDSARYDQTVTSVLTTKGDLIQRGASAPQRLAIGSAGTLLKSTGSAAAWTNTLTSPIYMSGATFNEAKGANIASASTINIGAATGNLIDITGAVTITGADVAQAGTRRMLRFLSSPSPLLTYSSTFQLPAQQNIQTRQFDQMEMISYGSGTWVCINYQRYDGSPLLPVTVQGGFAGLSIVTADGGTGPVVTARQIALQSAAGTGYVVSTVSATASIDTGSIASATWYYVWVFYNPTTGAITARYSLSATSPTFPSGALYAARVGSVRTKSGSAVFIGTIQYGRDVQYTGNPLPVICSGAQGTFGSVFAAISISAFVPPTASAIKFVTMPTAAGTNGIAVAPNNSYSAAAMNTNSAPVVNSASASTSTTEFVLESTNIYVSSQANTQVAALGWRDNL